MADKSVTATALKNNLGEYLARVTQGSQPVFVARHGRPVAVLVSVKKWEEAIGKRVRKRSAWLEELFELSDKILSESQGKTHTPTVELIRQIREEEG